MPHLSWLDLLIVLSVFGYVWGGFWTGLIQSIGGLVGLFLGEIIASRYYEHFSGLVSPLFNGNQIFAKMFAFILIFLIVTRLVGLAFYLVNKIFNFIAIIPGLKFLNRLGGAIFGFLEGGLFVGITLQFMVRLPISAHLAQTVHDSKLATYFLMLTAWLVPLFPKILKQAQDATKNHLPAYNTNVDYLKALNEAEKLQNISR